MVPDPCEIVPGLYQGSVYTSSRSWHQHGISVVIDLAGAMDPSLSVYFAWGLYVYWPIEDGPMPEEATIRSLAEFALQMMREGHKVLVRCQAGHNRSGLVTARVLIADGWSPTDAVSKVRDARGPLALTNRAFVDWLLNEGEQTPSQLVPHG